MVWGLQVPVTQVCPTPFELDMPSASAGQDLGHKGTPREASCIRAANGPHWEKGGLILLVPFF